MSHENLIVDKLSHRLPSLLPDFVKADSPALEQFIKAYFEFLEAEILIIESPEEIGDIVLEDGQGSMLLEPLTVAPSPDATTSKVVQEKSKQQNGELVLVSPLEVGEYVYGSISGTISEIRVVAGNTLYLKTISGNGFAKGETVTGRDGNFTAKVKSFKENTILANNRLLDYSDIDHTTESFVEYFQKDFVPSLNLKNVKNKRLAIKNIGKLYKKKGTEESLKFLMRILYGEDAEISYPYEQTIQISESNHSQKRRMVIRMDNENLIPSATDKIIQYTTGSDFIEGDSIVENVYNLESDKGIYSIEITDSHKGTFTEGSVVNLVDRDGVTNVTARVLGVISDIAFGSSSTYFETDTGDNIVLETVSQRETVGNVLATQQDIVVDNDTTGGSYQGLGTFDRGDIVQFDNHSTQYRIIKINSTIFTIEKLSSPHGTGLETDVPSGTLLRKISEGLITENNQRGSLYDVSYRLDFTGGNRDKDVVNSRGILDGVTSGSVDKIYIEDGGSGYHNTFSAVTEGTVDQIITEDGFELQYEDNSYCITEYSESSTKLIFGTALDNAIRVDQEVFGTNISRVKVSDISEDRLSMTVSSPLSLTNNSILQIGLPQLVVFDNRDTRGSGAKAIIGSVGDEIILENKDVYGQFEFTATAGQTLFNGIDNYGMRLIFNDEKVKVFVDGIQYTQGDVTYGYTKKNDRIVFNSGLTAGQKVDIYQQFNNLTYEDGTRTNLETTESNIRTINIIDGGTGYTKIPKVYPGGYIYLSDTSGYDIGEQINQEVGEVVTATGLLISKTATRLEIARRPTDTGTFLAGTSIVGGTSATTNTSSQVNVSSGTGAKLFAYSDTIGGVASINIEEQGYNFSEDGLIASTSHHPLLIETPTTNLQTGIALTGDTSGTTATVVSYDADRHILTYTDLDGDFLDEEIVSFNATDEFKVIKNHRFDGRGKFGGEGIIEEQLLGDKSTLDASASNIHDGKFYQTHSYVIKVGESINEYRSAVKDLLHPAGHIFFGEVAIKNVVISDESAGIISADSSLQNVNIETRDDVDNSLNVDVLYRPTIIIFGEPTLAVINPFSNSSRVIELHEFLPHGDIVFEDGSKPLIEDNTTGFKVGDTNYFRMEDTTVDPLVVLQNAGLEDNTPTVDNSGSIIPSTVSNPAGIALGARSEYYDSSHKNRHFNINVINSFAYTPVQSSPRLDGAITVLNLCRADDNNESLTPINSFGLVPERRPSDQGKVFSVFTQEEEVLVMEDGSRIEMEEHIHHLRFEPNEHAVVKGVNGDRMLLEDGDIAQMESATQVGEIEYFVSERTIDLFDNELYTEDNHRMIMEDGSVLVHEQSSENNISTFIPLGHTLRTLNIIQGQQTYDISYYLKDETDNDDLLLEDGSGNFLKEESKTEGIRISDFEYYYPKMNIPDYPLHERKRTNIGFSTYVKSA